MASGAINVTPLITRQCLVDDADREYARLNDKNLLAIVIKYPKSQEKSAQNTRAVLTNHPAIEGTQVNVSFVGAGNYASRILIPAFRKEGANLQSLITDKGVSAIHHGEANKFSIASTEIKDAFSDETDLVVLATQHNLHAQQVVNSIKAQKHVFVEKPLALTHTEIDEIQKYATGKTMLMVGYNRRFSPLIRKMKSLLQQKSDPKTFIITVNAGYIPPNHWVQDSKIGGGRVLGEACHFIDLMRFLADSKIKGFEAIKIGETSKDLISDDKAIISLMFEDGSIGSIHYFANGGNAFPKERIEVFCDDAVLQLNNFMKLKGFGWEGFRRLGLWKQDKGQRNCAAATLDAIKNGGNAPIPLEEIFEVARVSVDIAESLR
jgi:predicted dehydrogenase